MEKIDHMITLCLTLKNENIEQLIHQIAAQTLLPDEIIIIDSSEKSWENRKYNKIFQNLNIKYIGLHCSRSEGRNKAANLSTSENLLFIDGGCTFHKNAVSAMKICLSRKASEIVGGRYLSQTKNFTEYLFAKFLNMDLSKSSTIYPSARIFGIKKKIFNKLKGFNEKLLVAEDTEFFKRALDQGVKIEKCLSSVVFWNLPNLKEYFIKIFSYAEGDAKSEIWWDSRKKFGTHNIKHLLTLFRWMIICVLIFTGFYHVALLLIFVYLYTVSIKHQIDFLEFSSNNLFVMIKNVIVYVIIKIATDWAAMTGFIKGFF
jgi:hypothetical protein